MKKLFFIIGILLITAGCQLPFKNTNKDLVIDNKVEPMLGQASPEVYNTAGYKSWVSPYNVYSADVACWGGGGAGFDGTNSGGGAGGGGGAFASSTVTIIPNTQYTLFIGAGGSGSGANGATSTFATTTVIAAPGLGATSITTGIGRGGVDTTCTGTVRSSGGNGGVGVGTDDGGGGGGGAGGPHGAGEVGGDATSSTGGAGGRGDATYGGTAGAAGNNPTNSGNGGVGGTSTLGGGGGGGADNTFSGGAGGTYGGGGGGGETTPWTGATGACTITYRTNATSTIDLNTPNSPADGGTGVSVTPELNFIGTDANADTIEYNVQVDTANTFDDQKTIVESYVATPNGSFLAIYGVRRNGQSFTNDTGGNLNLISVKFLLAKNGTPTVGNVYVDLYAHDAGTYGSTGEPTGSALATSDAVSVSSVVNGYNTFIFSGSNQYTLVNGTHYFIVVRYDQDDAINNVLLRWLSSGSAGGNPVISLDSGGSWSTQSGDAIFYVYSVGFPLLSKFSVSSDATFTNVTDGGGHPFDSGDQIKYVVQAGALQNSTQYFWRVAGNDSGTHATSSWSDIHSFTTTSGAAPIPKTGKDVWWE